MSTAKTRGFVIEASADEWFGARAAPLSPGAAPVRSISGFPLTTARGIAPAENGDLRQRA